MKICFLSLSSYPMLTETNQGYAGGAELQQVLLAKALLSNGYETSFVTYDHGQKQVSYVMGIEIIKVYKREKANEINPFARLKLVCKALDMVKADLYFYSAGSPGVMSLLHLLKRKKFIYRIPSDGVVLRKTRNIAENFGQLADIKEANVVVVQSEFQRRKLWKNFGVEGKIIKNSIIAPRMQQERSPPTSVLWIGSISHTKRPQLFVELAKSIPNTRFEMVGGERMGESKLFYQIQSLAEELPNLVFHGFVPYHEINKFFSRAKIFINTSSIEGFPNTFLQSWAHCVPVVSLKVDPDQIIQNKKLGFCSKTFTRLVSDVRYLLHNNALRNNIGNHSRSYVEEEYNLEAMTAKYIETFNGIVYNNN